MISASRTDSAHPDFQLLFKQLDKELKSRYGDIQATYDEHNVIESIDTVVLIHRNSRPVGCGCFKPFDADSVEVKRMYVVPQFRGQGFSKQILAELENWAAESGFKTMILETGSKQHEAIGLYRKQGYTRIENYGPYTNMPNSLCFQKMLTGS